MSLSPELKTRIDEIIASDKVVLFMKGNRNFPQCGFSASVVQILNGLIDEYTTVNVLSDPEIRQAIKDYSQWPTIPQLYVRGEFVGGSDIVRELHASGELQKMLGAPAAADVAPPAITVTPAAAKALREALADADAGDFVHIGVSNRFEHSMDLGPKGATDIAVTSGDLTVLVDPISAKRAGGLVIDFVDSPSGAGFRIENPNAPPQVKPLSAGELAAKLKAGEVVELFDVRTPQEIDIARIDGGRLLDDAAMAYIDGLAKDTPIAFYCHTGRRSLSAAEHFRDKGFTRVFNLTGGIDAWSREVDPKVPRY
ncbi:MAG TPA: Grx4 family monothiol glutaredoxin [Kofleriaceae bacterium]|jgi:monothiol glutaredoxin|nr:Grx4 family monothiol glutaredoxin [Kofleriaceae bacterium]